MKPLLKKKAKSQFPDTIVFSKRGIEKIKPLPPPAPAPAPVSIPLPAPVALPEPIKAASPPKNPPSGLKSPAKSPMKTYTSKYYKPKPELTNTSSIPTENKESPTKSYTSKYYKDKKAFVSNYYNKENGSPEKQSETPSEKPSFGATKETKPSPATSKKEAKEEKEEPANYTVSSLSKKLIDAIVKGTSASLWLQTNICCRKHQ